ncbi:ROK family protein [Deinococcus ruber]|uniref:Glucokinase n=1 Tax=Deinococcus ruber TaxID=1848197 RepID=A0A918FB60_9DEIO|nr:ROK family protein [Deinococcus ruber]GGR26713.1 glucokinase [Deinococcus ruber]
MTITLAMDIGGTHVSAALVGSTGLLRASLQRTHINEAWPADRLLDAWAQTALTAVSHAASCDQVALSVPGPFDYQRGVAHFDLKMRSLTGLNITRALEQRWAGTVLETQPISYVNDAVAFTRGEYLFGAGRGVRRLLGITLGTGLGSGFLVNGEAQTSGADVPPNGEIRFLPIRGGIADEHLSAPGLRTAYTRLGGEPLEPRELAERAATADGLARQVFREFGHDLGAVLKVCADSFQPDQIVVGGQISRAWPLFAAELMAQLAGFTVVRSELLDDANLLGAAQRPHTARAVARSDRPLGVPEQRSPS